MYKFHVLTGFLIIDDMTAIVCKTLNVQKGCEQYETTRKAIQDYWQDKIAVCWTARDIISTAKDMGKPLTVKKANEILQSIFRNYNADTGINWSVIRHAINESK